ncbi:GNAT family N-acetyltransferase [Salmonella enterica]|uniref:GNAT family N-acetyltransferase n=1 Tax=Salmonella enterica TaxID=28901 RepID=UPI001BB0C8CE|nr:GNAT family protein [Salmonella enterica]
MKGDIFRSVRIRLCAPRVGDEKEMSAWYDDVFYLRSLDTEPAYPRSEAKIEKEINGTKGTFYFHIRTLEDDRLIGFVTLHSLEWNNQRGTLAIGIGSEKDRGQGFGDEALKLILHYAFMELNLFRLSLDVIANNKNAINLYLRNGFIKEGVIRKAVCRDNQRHDLIVMGILRQDWLNENYREATG